MSKSSRQAKKNGSWPSYEADEIEAVSRVLASGDTYFWAGEEGELFEREFAEWTEAKAGFALANGTAALDLCWAALDLEPGDEIVVPARTSIAPAMSIVNAGAVPVFADVDPDSQNLTPETAAQVLSPRTRAILCVHLNGWPCDMQGFRNLAEEHLLHIVEDCAHAHGAMIDDWPVGSQGHAAAWSFGYDKIISTGGEGGMVTTSNLEINNAAMPYRDHGAVAKPPKGLRDALRHRWLRDGMGTNARLTEMQSAIGRIQLSKLPEWRRARTRNAKAILKAARSCPGLRVPAIPRRITHAWHKCYVFVQPEALKSNWSRDRVMGEIFEAGGGCFQGVCPEVYLERVFKAKRLRPVQRLPVAKELGETAMMFPVHPNLSSDDIDRICSAIVDVMAQATR